MRQWKKIVCILLCGLLLCGLAACVKEPEEDAASSSEEVSIQINPLPEAVSKDKETARLYFGYMHEPLLIGEVRVFSVPINENIQTSIITELIKGPSAARADFTQIIMQLQYQDSGCHGFLFQYNFLILHRENITFDV